MIWKMQIVLFQDNLRFVICTLERLPRRSCVSQHTGWEPLHLRNKDYRIASKKNSTNLWYCYWRIIKCKSNLGFKIVFNEISGFETFILGFTYYFDYDCILVVLIYLREVSFTVKLAYKKQNWPVRSCWLQPSLAVV